MPSSFFPNLSTQSHRTPLRKKHACADSLQTFPLIHSAHHNNSLMLYLKHVFFCDALLRVCKSLSVPAMTSRAQESSASGISTTISFAARFILCQKTSTVRQR